MERELHELRHQLQQTSPTTSQDPHLKQSASATTSPTSLQNYASMDDYLDSRDAVESLMGLRAGADNTAFLGTKEPATTSCKLEKVHLTQDQVRDLFNR